MSAGCAIPGPGAPHYPNQTQAAAAEAFLTQHQGKIGLVTVLIGGNDLVIDCASSKDPVGCVIQAAASSNVTLTPSPESSSRAASASAATARFDAE